MPHKPFSRKVIRVGNSLAVTIPDGASEEFDLDEGDTVGVDLDRESGRVEYLCDE